MHQSKVFPEEDPDEVGKLILEDNDDDDDDDDNDDKGSNKGRKAA